MGYSAGILCAALLTVVAITSRIGTDLLELLTSMFNPLPAIALLPLALIWFGLGAGSIVFVIIHSVLWAVALNTHSGFLSVSNTLRMVGRNYGLRGLPYVVRILIPAAFPSILTGLKIGWAFAWRTLIAAELVFGVSSGSGGLGWFIYENKNQLEIPNVFAGLFTVIVIGLIVENVVFRVVGAAHGAQMGAAKLKIGDTDDDRTHGKPHSDARLSALSPRVSRHRSRGGPALLRRIPGLRRRPQQRRLGRLRFLRPPDRRAQGRRRADDRGDEPCRRQARTGTPFRRRHGP